MERVHIPRLPVVGAVMVTGKPGREWLAKQALAAFLAQTYANKRLFIINDGAQALLPRVIPGVVELRPGPGMRLGALRNYALDHIPDDVRYVVQWDDDDWSRPDRLGWQVEQQMRTPNHATVFLYEAHLQLHSGKLFVCRATKSGRGGFPGTIMHPRTGIRYQSTAKGEDTFFVRRWRGGNRLRVLTNPPLLYTRLFHGLNTWHEAHVMRFRTGSREATPQERLYIQQVGEDYRAAAPSNFLENHAVADQLQPGAVLEQEQDGGTSGDLGPAVGPPDVVEEDDAA